MALGLAAAKSWGVGAGDWQASWSERFQFLLGIVMTRKALCFLNVSKIVGIFTREMVSFCSLWINTLL